MKRFRRRFRKRFRRFRRRFGRRRIRRTSTTYAAHRFKMRKIVDVFTNAIDPGNDFITISCYPTNTASTNRFHSPESTSNFASLAALYRYFEWTFCQTKFIPWANTSSSAVAGYIVESIASCTYDDNIPTEGTQGLSDMV